MIFFQIKNKIFLFFIQKNQCSVSLSVLNNFYFSSKVTAKYGLILPTRSKNTIQKRTIDDEGWLNFKVLSSDLIRKVKVIWCAQTLAESNKSGFVKEAIFVTCKIFLLFTLKRSYSSYTANIVVAISMTFGSRNP